jgi:hypothetical protein
MRDFLFSQKVTPKGKKLAFKVSSMQVDNQLVRQNDAIVLRKDGNS